MKISNIGQQNLKQSKRPDARRAEGTRFSDLLKEEALGEHLNTRNLKSDNPASTNEYFEKYGITSTTLDKDTANKIKNSEQRIFNSQIEYIGTHYDLSANFPYASFPMKIGSLTDPVKLNLGRLTEAKRAELNEKYQIGSIKPGSQEYLALIKDLQKEGILSSGNAYELPPNVVRIRTDANGNISAISTTFSGNGGKDGNIFDYTRNLMSFASEQYETLKEKDSLTIEEQAVVCIYESHHNILAAIEEIFSEQLNLEK